MVRWAKPVHIAAIGVLFSLAAPCIDGQETAESNARPEVIDLDFEGVEAADEEELRESIATDESKCRSILVRPFCLFSTSPLWVDKAYLDREETDRDVLRIRIFYWRRGYREAQASVDITPAGDDEVRVTFTVVEGEPTTVSRIEVRRPDTLLTDRQIERLLALRAGDPFDVIKLDTSLVRLRQRLWNRGYSDAVIDTSTVVDKAARTAAITITVDPRWQATVDRILVTGNERIADRTILNSLTLRPGELYRRSDVVQSQRNLYESNLFQYAAIVVPPQGDSTKFIQVQVREAPLQEVRAAAGFNTAEFVQLEARYVNYNWFGRARRLELRGVVGNLLAEQLTGRFIFRPVTRDVEDEDDIAPFLRPNYQVSADLQQPWFLSPRNTLSGGLFLRRRSRPGVYIDRGYGANAAFTRNVAPSTPISLSYRYEVARVDAGEVYFCVNFGVCDEPTVDLLQASRRLSPLSLTGSRERTDSRLAPTRGHRAQIEFEHASDATLSEFHYNRGFAEGAYYVPMKEGRWVLASRVRLGIVRALASTLRAGDADDPILHPRKRFYAGGSQSVRGFTENQLGPRILTIPPNELRGLTVRGADTTYLYCEPSIPIEQCDPNASIRVMREGQEVTVKLKDDQYQPRPLGGTSLIQANAELRVRFTDKLTGALFVDGALVGEKGLAEFASATGAITPGFGIRYRTPVGPVRVDIGINPKLSERLDVVTQVDEGEERQLVTIDRRRVYAPGADATGLRRILSRLTLHLSIGEAF